MIIRSLAAMTLVAAIAAGARAQPVDAQAEMMFRNAKRLLAQGKIAEACAAFDASQKLAPTISTLLNQASCREKNSQLATAWGLFLDAEHQTRASTDEDGKRLHKVAAEHAAKLESRFSTLTIVVSTEPRPPGLVIQRDSDVVEPVMWNQVLPVDGGTYKIIARVSGLPPWSKTVVVANENDAKSVDIPRFDAPVTAAKPVEAASAAPPAPREPTKAPPPPREPVKTPAPEPAAADKPTWWCTDSHKIYIATCKLQRADCDAFRSSLIASWPDLVACHEAATASCFEVDGKRRCAPSQDACDAIRTRVTGLPGTTATACATTGAHSASIAASAPAAPAPAAPPPTVRAPAAPTVQAMWWCTDSPSSNAGVCQQTKGDCEAFRSSRIKDQRDLTKCHEIASAMCFDVGRGTHCASNRNICDAQREALHQTEPCYAKTLPPAAPVTRLAR